MLLDKAGVQQAWLPPFRLWLPTCCLQNGMETEILANGFSIPLAGLPLECLLDCCTVVTTDNGERGRLLCAFPAGLLLECCTILVAAKFCRGLYLFPLCGTHTGTLYPGNQLADL